MVILLQSGSRGTRQYRPVLYISHCHLIYLASCEEEVSEKGGIESVLPGLPPISFAVVGEPTEMQPAIAEKGLMVLDVTATGKAGDRKSVV